MTAEDVKRFREETGMGLMDSKKALEYANGDFKIAKAYIQAKTLAVATPDMTFDQRVKYFLKQIP